ncbi:autophagy-related protein 27 [Melanogaster broomeanus]|nr:autophagy-related protein 27 [Melanogaster broomeanus]
MSLRRQVPRAHPLHSVSFLLLLSSALHAAAQDCHFTVGELNYDLSSLGGVKTASRTRASPPSTFDDELRFDLCGELPHMDDRAEEDQCPSGTIACLVSTNNKGENSARITAVIPLAQSEPVPETSALSSPKGIAMTFYGDSYPPSSSNSVSQSLRIELACAESTSEPQFSSYENGQVLVEWSSPAGCGSTETPPPPNEDESKGGSGGEDKGGQTPMQGVGSGLGFFFLMLLLAFASYFALGAYYNYSTYGARGLDLIPHRDFWREVPYMLQDVVAHLCSNVRMRRSSRGGYIAV